MPFAARINDPSNHPGMITPGPGVPPRVFIEKKPAARAGDVHICAFPAPAGPHPANKIEAGSVTVFMGGLAAARVGDLCTCGALISIGAFTVNIGP